MRRTLWRLLAILALLVWLPVGASAVSFRLADYRMDIAVEPNGTGLFTETMTYAFDGEYNGILLTIRHEGVDFSDLRVFGEDGEYALVDALDGVPDTYTAVTNGDRTEIRVYSPGADGRRVFTATYQIGGFAVRYRDTARVNYLLLRAQADYDGAAFTIALPGDDDARIEAFFHGAVRQDTLRVRGGVIDIAAGRLSDGDWVEAQALFPAAWLPEAETVDRDIRQEALETEARIAAEAEAAREREAALARTMRLAVSAALCVYAAGFAAAFFAMRGKYGLRHPILSTQDDALLREIPAATAEVLRGREVSASCLSATLLELTERGALTMREEDGDACFTPCARPEGLWPHQQALLDWLFGDGEALWLSALDMRDDYPRAQRFNRRYGEWQARVKGDVYARQWQYRNGAARGALSFGAAALGLGLALALLALDAVPLALAALALAAPLCVLFARLRRLTDEGEKRLAALNGFIETYLDRLESDPARVLGRVPLVMALGYLRPMAEWIDAHPAHAEPAHGPVWMLSGWHHRMARMEHSVREARRHNAGAQNPEDTDGGSSGRGGSSGGGGGGSSHGAW